MPLAPEELPERSLAVIFISRLKPDAPGYEETARRMVELVKGMPGFLGMASWRDEEGRGVTISWWRDEHSIRRWRDHPEHAQARHRGDAEWYVDWHIQICQVQRFSRKARI